MTRRLLPIAVALALVGLVGCTPADDTTTRQTAAPSVPVPPASSSGATQLSGGEADGITPLPAGQPVDYQLGGDYHPADTVRILVRDRTSEPVSGLYNICYVNAFQVQTADDTIWADPANADLVLRDGSGNPVIDEDWDEALLDTSTASKRERLLAIIGPWIDQCAADGFDAVEPDNLDSWTRSDGRLTMRSNLAFASLLIARAHEAKLAIAQKNAVELDGQGKAAGFDFAVAESCQHWNECEGYTGVYGAAVIEIEYADQPRSDFTNACTERGEVISVVRRDLNLVARGSSGYLAQWC